MTTKAASKSASAAPPERLSVTGVSPQIVLFRWEELARTLFAARGIDSGLWHVGTLLHFAAATAHWDITQSALPTGTVGVAGVTLTPVTEPGPMVFDAQALLRTDTPRPGALLIDPMAGARAAEKQPGTSPTTAAKSRPPKRR